MPFVPAPNIIQVQFRQTYDVQQTMNRIFVNVLTVPTEAICQDLATQLGQWWLDNVQALVTSRLALREVIAISMAEENGPEATFTLGLPASGTNTPNAMPNNISLAMSLRSNAAGRSARGRWYWQGFTEDHVDGNLVLSGIITSIDAALTALKSVLTDNGWVWSIVSYVHNGVPRVGGPVYFPVLNILAVDSVVDSQRRRLPGRGR